MIYYRIEKNRGHLCMVEDVYDPEFALKTETVFAQCNGFLGVRASFDSKILEENRGLFVSGLYNKAYEEEVSELVKCPDLTLFEVAVDGIKVSLDSSEIISFRRAIDLRTGELEISTLLRLKNGKRVKIKSERFASFSDVHVFCHRIMITLLDGPSDITVTSGIDGQVSNSGVSHFDKVDCRVYDKKIMSLKSFIGKQSLSLLSVMTAESLSDFRSEYSLKRRGVFKKVELEAKQDETVVLTKISHVSSTIELDSLDETRAVNSLEVCIAKGYEALLAESEKQLDKIWDYATLVIDGATNEEEAAICFAEYHLLGMTPRESQRTSVTAKGLSGEGYKGHIFWDTEIFVLPFFSHILPNVSKNLLAFRFHSMEGARVKARKYGYDGAMFPWEVTSEGVEETPLYAALNIHTGIANKVWSGIKEHHVTADIAYAVWEYFTLTNDHDFMHKYGYRIMFESAIFWCSRAVFDEATGRYSIMDVIGPDEYTEHIDNNAYTNYMAHHCVKTAAKALEVLESQQPLFYAELDLILDLKKHKTKWDDFIEKIYLPIPNEFGIIPQDDTFLSKVELPNIAKYKRSKIKQSILKEYSRDEIVDMQVLKQADVVMLFVLFPNLFDKEIVRKNILYYEARTIHDSSLSYSVYAQACAKIGETDMTRYFFQKAMEIDIDDNPFDSRDGIHAASLGGLWNCVMFGFAGISHGEDSLDISPFLPDHWNSMSFHIKIRGVFAKIYIDKTEISITCEKELENEIGVRVFDTEYKLKSKLVVLLTNSRVEG